MLQVQRSIVRTKWVSKRLGRCDARPCGAGRGRGSRRDPGRVGALKASSGAFHIVRDREEFNLADLSDNNDKGEKVVREG